MLRLAGTAFFAASLIAIASGPSYAAGDPAKGETEFRRCAACHSVAEGENKIGPSLHNIVGRQAGTVADYNYSDSYVTAGEQGLEWTTDQLIAYLEDPVAFLKQTLDTNTVRTKMRNKFRKLELRENIAAYLESISAPQE